MEIYAITDVNGAIRYIGQSHDAAGRQREHWGVRFKRDFKLYWWMRTLAEPPSWHILAVVADELANSTERRFIIGARVAFPGLNLNVRARGGWSPEQRARLSEARKGRVFSPETRAKIGASNRGQKRRPEVVEATQRAQTANWADPEYRTKQIATHRTPDYRAKKAASTRLQRHSGETKAKIAAVKAAQWADPEFRRKATEAHIGQKPSAETVTRRGAAISAAWERRRSGQTGLNLANRFAYLDPDTLAGALQRVKDGSGRAAIAAELGISLSTLARALRLHRAIVAADQAAQES